MRRSLLILAALLLLAPATALSAGEKTFTPDTIHSRIGFSAKTLFKVDGNFGKYTTAISGDPDTLENATVRVEIEAASINTENKSRDRHLKSPDFFDAAKYPAMTFESTRVEKAGEAFVIKDPGSFKPTDYRTPGELLTGFDDPSKNGTAHVGSCG